MGVMKDDRGEPVCSCLLFPQVAHCVSEGLVGGNVRGDMLQSLRVSAH